MADVKNPETSLSKQSTVLDSDERRRPGRVNSVSPTLVSLLRRPLPDSPEAVSLIDDDGLEDAPSAAADQNRRHDLAAAQGVLVGLVLSLPLWALIILAVSAIF